MAQGGRRPGAGRKPGSRDKFSAEMLKEAAETGELPLEYLLGVMRDESNPIELRVNAAKVAAPYVHPKLSAITVDMTMAEMTHEEWLATLEG